MVVLLTIPQLGYSGKSQTEARDLLTAWNLAAVAHKVWRQLGTSPQKFGPLTEAVLALIHQTHPDFFPLKLEGDTWAYDLSSNSFTAITPNLHTSLLAGRDKRHKGDHATLVGKLSIRKLEQGTGEGSQTPSSRRRFNSCWSTNHPKS